MGMSLTEFLTEVVMMDTEKFAVQDADGGVLIVGDYNTVMDFAFDVYDRYYRVEGIGCYNGRMTIVLE